MAKVFKWCAKGAKIRTIWSHWIGTINYQQINYFGTPWARSYKQSSHVNYSCTEHYDVRPRIVHKRWFHVSCGLIKYVAWFYKGTKCGCFLLINKLCSWVQSALRAIWLYNMGLTIMIGCWKKRMLRTRVAKYYAGNFLQRIWPWVRSSNLSKSFFGICLSAIIISFDNNRNWPFLAYFMLRSTFSIQNIFFSVKNMIRKTSSAINQISSSGLIWIDTPAPLLLVLLLSAFDFVEQTSEEKEKH